MEQIIHNVQDMTHLSWSLYRNSSGTAGSFLKSQEITPDLILCGTLEQYHDYLTEYVSEFCILLSHTSPAFQENPEEYRKTERAFNLLRKACYSNEEKELVDLVRGEHTFQRIASDPRIGDTLVHTGKRAKSAKNISIAA